VYNLKIKKDENLRKVTERQKEYWQSKKDNEERTLQKHLCRY
jgi:hypothetical protein